MSPQAVLVSQGLSSSNTSLFIFKEFWHASSFAFILSSNGGGLIATCITFIITFSAFVPTVWGSNPKRDQLQPTLWWVSFPRFYTPHLPQKKSKSTFKRFRTWNMKCQLFDWQSKWMGVFDCRKAFVRTLCKGLCKTLTFFSSGFCLKTSSILF